MKNCEIFGHFFQKLVKSQNMHETMIIRPRLIKKNNKSLKTIEKK